MPDDHDLELKLPDDTQINLFGREEAPLDWDREWQGMPEFSMGNTEPIQKITISFATKEDVRKFATLIGQPVTSKTDSLWFPKQDDYKAPGNYRWVDES